MQNAVSYDLLYEQGQALVEGERTMVSNLANFSALIYGALDELNWAGFYILQGDHLQLGPFQGKPACLRIPLGKGVCGTAAALNAVQRVADVHAFPGHIACDSASASEIVIPLHHAGRVIGVLDMDSPVKDRFSQADQDGLTRLCLLLESACDWQTL